VLLARLPKRRAFTTGFLAINIKDSGTRLRPWGSGGILRQQLDLRGWPS
jgi:hypothetical protein